MLKTNIYPKATTQYTSFSSVPLLKEHNFKLVPNKAATSKITKRSAAAHKAWATRRSKAARSTTRKAKKRPCPVRSAKSTLAWNIIYANKLAAGWRPQKPSLRYKAFLQFQKAQVATRKAETALNKSKAANGSPIDFVYLVASTLKPAKATKAAPAGKRKSRQR